MSPITYDSLYEIVKIWVDAAFRITPRDLKIMERLAKAQIIKNIRGDEHDNGVRAVDWRA
jgi:DSF synthase